MPATPGPPVLPPSWLQVLEKIEASLTETVQQSAAPAPAQTDPAAARDAAWQEALARLDDRLAALQEGAARAARSAAATDAALAGASAELDGWLGALQAAGRKLAETAGGAIS